MERICGAKIANSYSAYMFLPTISNQRDYERSPNFFQYQTQVQGKCETVRKDKGNFCQGLGCFKAAVKLLSRQNVTHQKHLVI